MAPRPPPSPTLLPSLDNAMSRGQRRNFYEERFEHPHKFLIGTRVFMQTPVMSIPIGPMIVVEYCKPLFARGPPQYILQPCVEVDDSKWVLANELHMYEVDEDDNPVPIQ